MGCAVCWLDQKDVTWKYTGCVIRWLDWKNVVTWKGTWNVLSNHMGMLCPLAWPKECCYMMVNLKCHIKPYRTSCPPAWPKEFCHVTVNLKCYPKPYGMCHPPAWPKGCYIKPYVMRHPPAWPKGCCCVTEPEMLHETIYDMPSVGFTTWMLLGERSGRVVLKFYIKPWGTSIEIQLSELL